MRARVNVSGAASAWGDVLAPLKRRNMYVRLWSAVLMALCCAAISAKAQAEPPQVPHGGTIGYVMTGLFWALYQSPDGQEECPQGFNDGPREQYARLFPGQRPLTLQEAQLMMESQTWHPDGKLDHLPFHLAGGRLSYGLNLDDRVDAQDFTHPQGEAGIDNQLFRVLGCIIGYRGPDGVEFIFQDRAILDTPFNRLLLEIDGVDDMRNDEAVTVTIFRGADRLLTDASGNRIMPGSSQTLDLQWGRELIVQMPGKIIDGVLHTEPLDTFVLPWSTLNIPSVHVFRGFRMQLQLGSDEANGLFAGYADTEAWYRQLLRNDSTHHLSNGQISAISIYPALQKLADGYPDPQSGANTAISTALNARFVQVFIIHPEGEAAKQALKTEATTVQPIVRVTAQ